MGSFYFFPLHFAAVLVLMFTALHKNKKDIVKKKILYAEHFVLLSLNFAIGAFVFEAMKRFFHYPRPYCVHDFHMSQLMLDMFNYSQNSCNYSFPSGHTAYIYLLVLSFWKILSTPLKVAGISLVLIVGMSRVILGAHFLADVTYALLISLYMIHPLANSLLAKYYPKYKPLVTRLTKKFL